ncbi:FHA domain-containing protein [Glaciihabitans tibetensis]|uniref:FHA domain-containing protein n=1 Tax=Glaciihabitans tibetensis TaxID=1266600 RepID=A0A2T0VG62_9MICO|nr:FHA domain-containing protein [Glaciihabitans tibetensis]PRY69199.1 FHA domain-containing protein [Glaciihabitans tibetensis]
MSENDGIRPLIKLPPGLSPGSEPAPEESNPPPARDLIGPPPGVGAAPPVGAAVPGGASAPPALPVPNPPAGLPLPPPLAFLAPATSAAPQAPALETAEPPAPAPEQPAPEHPAPEPPALAPGSRGHAAPEPRPESAQEPRGVALVLPDGTRHPLVGSVLIGRAPAALAGWEAATLLRVHDPERSVSKTHAALTVVDGEVRVSDLHSTNGVRVRVLGAGGVGGAGDTEVLVDVGSPAPVAPGDTVILGEFPIQLVH